MKTVFVLVFGLLTLPGAARADDTIWTRLWDPGGRADPVSVRCTGSDAFVSGTVMDTVSRSSDIFVAKYSSSGAMTWNIALDFDPEDNGGVLAVGPDGSPYVSLTAGRRPPAAKVVKLGQSGETLWTRSVTSALAGPLVADDSGNVLGLFTTGANPTDSLLLLRYDPAGNQTLHRVLRLAQAHAPQGICLTGAGEVIAAVDLSDTLGSTGALVKFTGLGDTVWTRVIDDSLARTTSAVAGADGDEFYFLGQGLHGPVLARMAADGETLWFRYVFGIGNVAGDIAVDSSRDVLLAWAGVVSFGLAKYTASGQFVNLVQSLASGTCLPAGVAVGSDNNPVYTGSVESPDGIQVLTAKFLSPAPGIAGPRSSPSAEFCRLRGTLTGGRVLLDVPCAGMYSIGVFSADGRRLSRRDGWLDAGVHEVDLVAGRGIHYIVVGGPDGVGRFKMVPVE